ncbi:MAG: aminotransferase class IV [Actinomycetes bacterium]
MKVWLRDGIVDDSDAVVSVFDHGLTVGDGVFETAKVIDGVPFALTRHLDRLENSASGLGLVIDRARVRAAVDAVLAANGALPHARLRITVTGGQAPLGSDRADVTPTLIVAVAATQPWPAYSDVLTVPWTRNERAATAGLKTTSYADNVVALARAHKAGANEAIFANNRGELCEGTGTNVFAGIDGVLVTPPLTSGCLPGVTRALLIEWLGDVDERPVPVASLAEAEEAFLASSTRDVQPIRQVDNVTLPACPGPLTERAAAVFAANAAANPDP